MIPPLLRCLCLGALLLPLQTVSGQLWRNAAYAVNLPLTTPAETNAPRTYSTVRALPADISFSSPAATTFPTGDTSRLYVMELGGRIWRLTGVGTNSVTKTLFMDLGAYLNTQTHKLTVGGECGLLAMAFHPDYQQNGYFYLFYSITAAGQLHQRLARFQATGTAGSYREATAANGNTESPLLTLYDRISNHNGGDLGFGNDGYLYLSLGDEGGAADTNNNARFINKNYWGQLLRLDVNNLAANLTPSAHSQASTTFPNAVHAGAYKIPANNPFIGRTSWHGQTITAASVLREIYATGFRNPFRFTFDPPTGRLFVGDVGQDQREEVSIVTAGADCGWSWREGNIAFTSAPRFPNSSGTTNPPSGAAFTPVEPIISYPRSNGTQGISGSSVCGGLVYRGTRMPELQGYYLVTDIYDGAIAAFQEGSSGTWTGSLLARRSGIVDFGINPSNGEPLLCNMNDGILYELTRDAEPATNVATRLSELGLFSNLTTLTPQVGIVPYEPNVSFWSDHATKRRWFALRDSVSKITYSAAGNWTFPSTAFWIKHFDINRVRNDPSTKQKLETRILVKTATGIYGLSYKWRADQSDADLVQASGLSEAIPNSNPPQTWRYPSRGECLTCHTAAAGYALSFHSAQLNKNYVMSGSQPQNQLSALLSAGYLSGVTAITPAAVPALATESDAIASLEWKARSYLEVNCAQCHRPGGGAQGNWDARYSTPTATAQLIHGTLLNNGGNADNRVIVPGDADHSMLLLRLQGSVAGLNRMPPLTTNERDLAGETLIADWITELADHQTFEQWQMANFGTTTGADYQPMADADGDGVSNEMEYLLGTDPADHADRWQYSSVTREGSQLRVRFPLPPNRAAHVETSRDLVNWTPTATLEGSTRYLQTESLQTFNLPLANRKHFFRVRFQRP